jgi:L-serine dehydratase
MKSLRELYRIGVGPSSSHTMGPRFAAEIFRQRTTQLAAPVHQFRVTLYGSLAATGRGHLTDQAIRQALIPYPLEILWLAEQHLPLHPNGMLFEALDAIGHCLLHWEVYSVGGGALREAICEANNPAESNEVYDCHSMADFLARSELTGQALWELVFEREGESLWAFLSEIWKAMQKAIENGLRAEGVLPGGLGLPRKAWAFHRKASMAGPYFQPQGYLAAYALAVSEENAAGGIIVTAPTCGACGILPAALYHLQRTMNLPEESILRALATAGLIGNLAKHNASISGAEVGCQGEVGVACAMAAAAATQLLGGTVRQIEYAAEMGLEHHLGLTCDPVGGLVQIPCIERNVFAAARALHSAEYALFSDGTHRIPFDEVLAVMLQTGHDLPSLYRETASGGLAAAYQRRPNLLAEEEQRNECG